jgi:predicted DNA-binding transcriptional regulator AlpA
MHRTSPQPNRHINVVDEAGAAALLGIARGTLRNWRSQCRGPRYARLGRRVVYRRADLDEYLNACLVEA